MTIVSPDEFHPATSGFEMWQLSIISCASAKVHHGDRIKRESHVSESVSVSRWEENKCFRAEVKLRKVEVSNNSLDTKFPASRAGLETLAEATFSTLDIFSLDYITDQWFLMNAECEWIMWIVPPAKPEIFVCEKTWVATKVKPRQWMEIQY